MEGKYPQVKASSNYVREKRCSIVARNGERCAGRGQTVVCHVDVCFLSVSRRGFKDLLKIRPSFCSCCVDAFPVGLSDESVRNKFCIL